jgi:cellulose synthase/poly-beta-1,6-N-acetylglucosamine synthase-like glycosyltransferase
MPDMIICPVKLESGSGFFTGFQELEFLSLQGITAGTASSGEGTMCNGANLSFTRKTYQDNSYNLHDLIDSGDDIFLLHSLKKQSNPKILWLESPEAIVTTSPSSTLREYLDQRKRWISKGMAYNDKYTILLAIVTFVAILLQVSTLIAGLINPLFWLVSLSIFILKSLPDYLILQNVSRRYDRRELMGWFIPAQLIYPFYVLGVVFYALIARKKQGH